MSIPADDAGDRYVGDGVTTEHAYNFCIASAGQLVAMQDSFVMTYGTHYLLSGIGDTDGGHVQWTTAPALDVAITIVRNESNSQETTYVDNEAYGPLKIQRDLDHMVRITQMLAEQISRAAKFRMYSPHSQPFLPDPEVGKFLQWANTGSLVNVEGELTDGGSFIDFDVIGDGVTDVTADLQAAWDAAATDQRTVYMPAGTYIVTNLAIATNLRVQGDGKGNTIIKRVADSASSTFIIGTNKNGFAFFDIGFDGNKANNATGAFNIELNGCRDFKFVRCASNNADGASAGAGIYAHDSTDLANNTHSLIAFSEFRSNDNVGIGLQECSNIDIHGNLCVSNTNGGIVTTHQFPPEASVNRYLGITNNICTLNGHGIHCAGFLQEDSILGDLIYGHSLPPVIGAVITGNRCFLNTLYGINYQAYGGQITSNYCEKNGFGSGYAAGITCQGNGTAVIGNVCSDNEAYGIDAGWSVNSNISDNTILATGSTSGLSAIGINLGRAAICANNNFSGNGTAAGGAHIVAPGFDTDANSLGAELETFYTNISGNNISTGHANMIGVLANRGHDFLNLEGNSVLNCTVAYAIQGGLTGVMNFKEANNIDWSVGVLPSIDSAAAMVIPDVGDRFLISGTTGIANIYTYSENAFLEEVRFVQITNAGSGYTSAPTVGFSGGGGSGAAGTAILSGDGKIIGVEMTNHGSGYTSAPTVGFTGGGGAAGAGTAHVGCNNSNGRKITLVFTDTLTVTDGGNLVLAGDLSAAANVALDLIRVADDWIEVSRSVN